MPSNNAIFTYDSFGDIESSLVKQWSGLFQSLLRQAREKGVEARKSDVILEQIEGLKAAVLQSFKVGEARDIAKSVLAFRALADFIISLRKVFPGKGSQKFDITFDEMIESYGLGVVFVGEDASTSASRIYLTEENGVAYRVMISAHRFSKFEGEWKTFSKLEPEIREAVIEGVEEASVGELSAIVAVHSNTTIYSRYIDDFFIASNEAPVNSVSSGWTEERLKTLQAMWSDGKTASEIAEVLGGVSRNAVIGKAHRLGLKPRPSPVKPNE